MNLGDASGELRNLLDYAPSPEIDRESYAPYTSAIFKDEWKRVAMDIHVRFFQSTIDKFNHGSYENEQSYKRFISAADIGKLFDFVEFLVRHPKAGV